MNWWRRLRHRDHLERALDAELRDHIERLSADYAAAGMTAAEARRRAVIEFGGLEQIKETCRDARGLARFDSLRDDICGAARAFRTDPGVAAVAVLTLALGIGANGIVFTILNGLYLRDLPVDSPASLVFVENCTGSSAVIDQLRARNDVFQNVGGWMATQFTVQANHGSEWLDGVWATPAYLETLGVRPQLGRGLSADAADEALISDTLWRQRFGAAPDVIGSRIILNHRPFTIVGVTPRDFTGIDVGRTFDVVAPFAAYALVTGRAADGCGPLSVVARLADGQTVASAAGALIHAQPRIRDALVSLMPPEATADVRQRFLSRPFSLVQAGSAPSEISQRYERPLLVVMTVAGLVLLVACATVANLFLARTSARRHDSIIRLSLGAPRWRLLRQSLIESLMVAGLAAVIALAVARQGSRLIIAELSGEGVLAIGRIIFGSARPFLDVSIDGTVIAFTTGMAAITALLFGIAPAVRASRMPSRTPRRPGDLGGLVIAQVALSMVILVAAGLFLRSLSSLLSVPLGFVPGQMLVVDITTPMPREGDKRMPLYERARETVRRLPGVVEATLSVSAPMTGWDLLVEVETRADTTAAGSGGDSLANIVTPGWFRTLGTPLVAGRDFTDDDRRDAPAVVLVNEAFARQFLPGGAALGWTIRISGIGSEVVTRKIVGVAADALWSLRDPVPPIVYVPLRQAGPEALESRLAEEGLTLAVRTTQRPESLRPSLATALGALDPSLTLTFRSPAEHISASLTQERIVALLTGFFGGVALLLAGIGLYGITAYSVSCRRAELAVRLALGESPGSVMRLVFTRVSGSIAGGVLLGIGLSIWLAPLMSTLLYGVEPHDAATLALAVLTLAAITVMAGALPARRAARTNPAAILRAS